MSDDLAARVDELEAKLAAVTNLPPIRRALTQPDDRPADWTVPEAAIALKVSTDAVYKWVRNGRLLAYRAGGRIWIPRNATPTPKPTN